MIRLTAAEVTQAINGKLIKGVPTFSFINVSSDTRSINNGDLFFALRGDHFDGHNFLKEAIASGAEGLVVEKSVNVDDWSGILIEVDDTLIALQKLAAYNRSKFKGMVIAVTGSNGKTTTKDMIFSVLQTKHNTLKTEANYNNQIGLPQTILKLDESYDVAVLEMGMRGKGEIDLLASIAQPRGAVITNVGVTHIELLGTMENIAAAKGELLEYIPTDGFALLYGDDEKLRTQASRCKGQVLYYGNNSPDLDIKAKNIKVLKNGFTSFTGATSKGEIEVNLPVPGKHNVTNALAAIGVGLQMGLTLQEIKLGLENVILTKMRLEIIEAGACSVINDTYNANPDSVKASLTVLEELGKGRRKVAILGDMFELGDYAVEGHRSVGITVAELGIQVLITVGSQAEEIALGASMSAKGPIEIISFPVNREAIKYIPKVLLPGDIILVKGSRGMKMEEIAKSIKV